MRFHCIIISYSQYSWCICYVQVAELQQLSAHKSDTDDQILSLVNAKSAEWERLLASRDAELAECHKLVQQLQQQLMAANMDTDKASVIKLSHVSLCVRACVCVVCACMRVWGVGVCVCVCGLCGLVMCVGCLFWERERICTYCR